jgi:hypothetical protein
MKKLVQFNIRVNEKFIENLDLIREKKPGIRTRTDAIHYCLDVVMMEIEKEKLTGGKNE